MPEKNVRELVQLVGRKPPPVSAEGALKHTGPELPILVLSRMIAARRHGTKPENIDTGKMSKDAVKTGD